MQSVDEIMPGSIQKHKTGKRDPCVYGTYSEIKLKSVCDFTGGKVSDHIEFENVEVVVPIQLSIRHN